MNPLKLVKKLLPKSKSSKGAQDKSSNFHNPVKINNVCGSNISNYVHNSPRNNFTCDDSDASPSGTLSRSGSITPATIEWWGTTPSGVTQELIDRSVIVGYDSDGSPLLAIRAVCEGNYIPGTLSVENRRVSVTWNKKQYKAKNIEVCSAPPLSVKWLIPSQGQMPPTAIVTGSTINGDNLYFGRVKNKSNGKVQPTHEHFAFAAKDMPKNECEIMCHV